MLRSGTEYQAVDWRLVLPGYFEMMKTPLLDGRTFTQADNDPSRKLVVVGLYGVLSTVVRQRTAEIGVRMALGADPSKILALVVGQGLRPSAIGVAAGRAEVVAHESAFRELAGQQEGEEYGEPAMARGGRPRPASVEGRGSERVLQQGDVVPQCAGG